MKGPTINRQRALIRKVMKLRDLVMSYGGINIWPPIWKPAKQGSLNTVKGEVGVLAYAHANPNVSGKCYLVMEYEDETYVGTLTFESQAFCRKVSDFLNQHPKKPIKEIGDLEL